MISHRTKDSKCKLLLLIAFLMFFIAIGCHSSEDADADGGKQADDDTPEDGENDGGDEDEPAQAGCGRHLVTRGFGLGWKWLNHRISLWEVFPVQPACPENPPGDASLHVGYVGGDFSTGDIMRDIPLFNYWGTVVKAEQRVSFDSGFVELFVSSEGGYEERVDVTLESDPVQGETPVVVLVSGISIETDVPQNDPDYPAEYDPAMGYTVRGFGAWIEDVSTDEEGLAFTVWGRFEPGPADRNAMNEAIEHARIRMTMHFTAISLGDGAFTSFSHGYHLTYPPPRLFLPQEIEHAPLEQRLVEIEGAPGYGIALPGVIGFNFDLFGETGRGDYIRELSIATTLVAYDGGKGTATIDVDGYASNSSLIAYETMDTELSAELALIQIRGGYVSPMHLEGAFETGRTEVTF